MPASTTLHSYLGNFPFAMHLRGSTETMGARPGYRLLIGDAPRAVLNLQLNKAGFITADFADTGTYLRPEMRLDLRDEHDQVMVECAPPVLAWCVGISPQQLTAWLDPARQADYCSLNLNVLTHWLAAIVDFFEGRPAVAISTSWHSAVDRLAPEQTTPFIESMLPENMAAEPLVIITAADTRAASAHDAAAVLGVMGPEHSLLFRFMAQMEQEDPVPEDHLISLFMDFDGLRQCIELATPFADAGFTVNMMGARAHAQHRRACFCDTLAALLAATRNRSRNLPRLFADARAAMAATTGVSLSRKITAESRGQSLGAIYFTSHCLNEAARELGRMEPHELAALGYRRCVELAAQITDKHALTAQQFADLQIWMEETQRFTDILEKERSIDEISTARHDFILQMDEEFRAARMLINMETEAA